MTACFEGNLHSAPASRCQNHCRELEPTELFPTAEVQIWYVLCQCPMAGIWHGLVSTWRSRVSRMTGLVVIIKHCCHSVVA